MWSSDSQEEEAQHTQTLSVLISSEIEEIYSSYRWVCFDDHPATGPSMHLKVQSDLLW